MPIFKKTHFFLYKLWFFGIINRFEKSNKGNTYTVDDTGVGGFKMPMPLLPYKKRPII